MMSQGKFNEGYASINHTRRMFLSTLKDDGDKPMF